MHLSLNKLISLNIELLRTKLIFIVRTIQTKHLTSTLPEIEIDEDPEEAIIAASIKLVRKVLLKNIGKEAQSC